eukprot:UN14540
MRSTPFIIFNLHTLRTNLKAGNINQQIHKQAHWPLSAYCLF